MRKLISILLCVVMLVSVFAGCSNDTTPDPTVAPTDAALENPSTDAVELPYEGVELVYWSRLYEGTPQADMLLQLAEEFKTNTGASIQVVFKGNEMRQIMPTALESKERIDIFDTASYFEAETIYDYMMDLTDYIEESDYLSKTYPIMMNDLVARTGFLSGVVNAPSMNTIWYNSEIFEDCGITTIPTTIEEFEAACDAMVAKGYTPWALDDIYVHNFFSQHISRYVGQDTVTELSNNGGWSKNEAVVEGAQTLIDWINAGYFTEGAPEVFPASQNKIGLTGKVAMVYTGSWVGAEVENATGTDIKWGCMAYPTAKSGVDVGVNSAYSAYTHIHKDCANPDAAYDFLMYFKTGEGDQRYTDAVKLPPCDINNTPPADFTGSVEYLLSAEVCFNSICAVANADMKAALIDVMTKMFNGEYATGLEAMEAMDALYS